MHRMRNVVVSNRRTVIPVQGFVFALACCVLTACGDPAATPDETDGSVSPPRDAGPPPSPRIDPCGTYNTVDGMAVMEAEALPITDAWRTGTAGSVTYIEWSDGSHNNNPSNGVFDVNINFAEAGTYQLQWRVRIGRGSNTTEHNDTWVSFPDAADFYGSKGPDDAQQRVYPKPQCDDDSLMDPIRALDGVASVGCPRGTSRDGFFKVYSTGADDWKWSARTNDHDAHDIYVRIDDPGQYIFRLAARADFNQIDRIVVHRSDVGDREAQDLGLATTCAE